LLSRLGLGLGPLPPARRARALPGRARRLHRLDRASGT
jgi:hypothetical protein